MLELPDSQRLAAINDASIDEFPDFVLLEQERNHPEVENVAAATVEAVDRIHHLDELAPGAEVGVTAGSRGIHDMPMVLQAIVKSLSDRGLDPFIFPAMGSHGGATAEGQREMLASLGITEETMGCEIRSSLAVEEVATDAEGRPIFAAKDALEADAVVVANRVKAHTDFTGEVESGLAKMTVIGIGKQRGAEVTHSAGLAKGLDEAIPERAAALFEHVPVVGGVAVIENADDRAAAVEGLPVEDILDEEPALLARSKRLLPTLPVDELDLLVIDEIGKNISGTGMDTNVVGRMLYHGQPEPEDLSYARIHVRSITEASHHNGIGIGLADFVHADAVRQLDLTDTYINGITGGEPARARIPVVCPTDEVAFLLAYSSVGVSDPGELRIARIPNTLELGRFLVSEPVAAELAEREDVSVVAERPLDLADGDLRADPYDRRY
ncbi:DUF362 domain-containing protein [Halegenticoccus soli]|uniref:DUF362 domain-containing protein n=1 Tax=Halegenticoccus soli TaxID=1985678 RepID=UPI000C6CA627|nr:DUF362 domain-containing protein [Halegenticoccus soli]